MMAGGAALVEVLPADEYEAEHLPGAINIPLPQFDRQTTAVLQQDQPIIVYESREMLGVTSKLR
jgi:rhodanese-related sulfurtransferase